MFRVFYFDGNNWLQQIATESRFEANRNAERLARLGYNVSVVRGS